VQGCISFKGFGKAYIMEFHFQSRLAVLCFRKAQHMFHSLPSIGCKPVAPNEQTHTFSVWLFLPSTEPLVPLVFGSFFLPQNNQLFWCFILSSFQKNVISFGVLLHLPSTKTSDGPCQVFTVEHKISLLLTPSSTFKSSSRMNF
jgi:hypothetical protein